jgi:hypothetical protein
VGHPGKVSGDSVKGRRTPGIAEPLQQEAAAALVQVITQRYLKSSIVMTTDLGVSSWGKIFDDRIVAAAMLDRLLPKSVVFNIEGESYQMGSHRAAQSRSERGSNRRLRSSLDPLTVVGHLGNSVDRPWGGFEIVVTVPDATRCPRTYNEIGRRRRAARKAANRGSDDLVIRPRW